MFATRPAFKNAMQLDDQRTHWRAVELMAHWPWFIATVILDEEIGAKQSFILSTDKDVGTFLGAPSAPGQFAGLTIILPPNHSPTRQWLTSEVIKIERPIDQEAAPIMPLIFLCADGTRYGGFPLEVKYLSAGDTEEVRRFIQD